MKQKLAGEADTKVDIVGSSSENSEDKINLSDISVDIDVQELLEYFGKPITKIEVKATKSKDVPSTTRFHDADIVLIFNIEDDDLYVKVHTGKSYSPSVYVMSNAGVKSECIKVGVRGKKDGDYSGPDAADIMLSTGGKV